MARSDAQPGPGFARGPGEELQRALAPCWERRHRGPLGVACLAAVAIHTSLWAGAALWAKPMALQVRLPPTSHVIELAPPPPPPVVVEPAPPPVQAAPTPRAPSQAPPPRPSSRPAAAPSPDPRADAGANREAAAPTPAQAGEVLAKSEAAAPIDFDELSFVSGTSGGFAGGTTSSGGTSTRAVRGPAAADGVPDGTGPGEGQGHGIRLERDQWDCPWPKSALALRQRAEEVVLQVVVRPNGTVVSAELLADPGNGFGETAIRCAKEMRFEPAHDATGRPILAKSPPIRVQFTR